MGLALALGCALPGCAPATGGVARLSPEDSRLTGTAASQASRPDGAVDTAAPRRAAAGSTPEARPDLKARMARVMAAMRAKSALEDARWDDAQHAAVRDLLESLPRDAPGALALCLEGPQRTPGHSARDRYRHPLETLAFFGLRRDMVVMDLGPGGGWYTELLAPVLGGRGTLRLVGYAPDSITPMKAMAGQHLLHFLSRSEALYGTVTPVHNDPPEQLSLGPDASVDLVLAFREMHNWVRGGYLDAYLAAVHAVLKEGGILGVVQHRAAPGSDPITSAERGYLPEAWVIQHAQRAGFALDGREEINSNPRDTRDYPRGVWALPPSLTHGDQDRQRYLDIGESDRMTLRFRKPDSAPPN